MKKDYLIVWVCLIFFFVMQSSITYSQSGNINNGSETFCASYTLYDDGGPLGDYSQNDYTMLICSTDGSPITLDVIFEQMGTGANLNIYDGNTTALGSKIWDDDFDGTGIVTATQSCVTVEFEGPTFASGIDEGFEITFYSGCSCGDGIQSGLETGIDCGGPHCGPCGVSDNISWDSYILCDDFTVYDDGGPSGTYSLDTYEMTICSQDGSNITFTVFEEQLATGTDFIIYAGTSASGTELYNDNFDAPGTYPTTTSCITILFDPPLSGTDDGFMVTFSSGCSGPVDCNDGIQNGYELDVDCGGKDCDACVCTNFDFETGDFTGWQMIQGENEGLVPYDFSFPVPHSTFLSTSGHCTGLVPDPTSYTTGGDEFFIHTVGSDTTCMGEFFDDVGSNVAVLGNGSPGAHAKKIRQEFNVPPNALYIEVSYSVLLEDPGHPVEDQPYFQIQVMDDNGAFLPCGDYQVIANQNLSGWVALDIVLGNVRLWGLPWTKKLVPIAGYVGQDITVEITVADCAQGAHFGQALVDASCNFVGQVDVLGQTGPTWCSPAELQAPAGYEYTWSTGETTQNINANSIGVYTVDIVSPGDSPACGVTLDVELEACQLAVTLSDWKVKCIEYPILNWSTSFEEDVDHFIVEKSCNGQVFSKIAEIEPNPSMNYQFEDRIEDICPSNVRYYRLSEVDLDGNVERFNVLSSRCDLYAPSISQANNSIKIEYDGLFDVQIISSDGKIVAQHENNMNNLVVNTSDFAQGIYVIHIESSRKFTEKLFIEK